MELPIATPEHVPLRPVVKRMYGRHGRKEPMPDASFRDSFMPSTASSRASSIDPPFIDPIHEYPPTSDGPDASASSLASFGSADASDKDKDDGVALSSHYEFDWRKKLREMDEDDGMIEGIVEDASGRQSMATTEVDELPNAHRTQVAMRDTFTVGCRSPSPFVQQRQRRKRALASPLDSDSEPIDALDQSPLPAVLMFPPARAKGKQKAMAMLESDEEAVGNSDDGGRTNKRTRSRMGHKPRRVKPPTRKEREETQKATARILAEQDASLPKEQAKQYNIHSLLSKFQCPAVSTPEEATVEVADTDPIQPFSSSPASHVLEERAHLLPRARSVSLKPFARTPSPAPGMSFQPTGLLGLAAARESSYSSEDEEMPEIGSLINDEAKKREERERLQRLAEVKRRALEHQRSRLPVQNEDDSDIEVVHEDMHAVAREEAQARRADAAHGVRRSVGRNVQLALAGISRQKSGVVTLPSLSAEAAPSYLRKKIHDGVDGQLTAEQLNRILLRKVEERAVAETRQKEERWERAGGKPKARPVEDAPGLRHAMAQYAQRSSEAQANSGGQGEADRGDDEDGDDPDYHPADEHRHASSDDEADSDAENRQVAPSEAEAAPESENDDENIPPVPRGRKGRPRRPLVVVHSDDEEEGQSDTLGRVLVADSSFTFPESQGISQGTLRRRASSSSLEGRTEEGTDKENDASLMYDRGDDKENTLVSSQPSAISRASSFFSQSQGRPLLLDDRLPMESTPQDGGRAPLQELRPADDDDNLFSVSGDSRGPARRLTFSPGPPLFPLQSDENSPVQSNPSSHPLVHPVALKGGLADFFESQGSSAVPSPAAVPMAVPGGGLSDFFSQHSTLDAPAQINSARASQDLALTEDVALQPALDIGQTLRRKADEIFEKEQQFIAECARGETSPEKKRLYVNEHGFLTQTRPMRTPARSQLFSPSQVAKVSDMSIQDVFSPRPPSRQPLATISAVMTNDDDDDDFFDVRPPTRLKRRKISPEKGVPSGSRLGSISPSPHKSSNVFDVLMKQAPLHPKKLPALLEKKEKRSVFIEGEAEESDDDDRRGFGIRKLDDDEEDDDTQDQTLEELVDDQEMDENTLAEDAVFEKHREHLEQDDQENEKLHQNAIQGKLRMAHRNRGIGFEDDESDEDDDDAARARRRMQRHKRKILGDTLDDLAKDPETAAFVQAYQDPMAEDNDDFEHMEQNEDTLVGSQGMDVDDEDQSENEKEDRQIVATAQLMQEVAARMREGEHVESIDPRDVSWVDDGEYEEDETLLVKEISGSSRKVTFRKGGDWDPSIQPKHGGGETERDRVRMHEWAKGESRVYGTGRTTGSVSVAGGVKKTGRTAPHATGRTAAHVPKQLSKVTKTPSMLSTVSTSRRAKFQG